MNLLQDLKEDTSSQQKQILTTLMETLDHFEISDNEKETVGEALLRFRIFKDRKISYSTNDVALERFLKMDKYFTELLKEKRGMNNG